MTPKQYGGCRSYRGMRLRSFSLAAGLFVFAAAALPAGAATGPAGTFVERGKGTVVVRQGAAIGARDVAVGLDRHEVPPGRGLGDPETPANLVHRQEAVAPDEAAEFLAAEVDDVLGHAHGGTVTYFI